MSEHITHVAIYEDAVRLALHAGTLSEAAEQSLRRYYDTGLCMSASRGNHLFAVPFIEEVRERRRGPLGQEENEFTGRLLAAALGWVAHRATDDVLDDAQVPLLEELREQEGLSEEDLYIDEHQTYHDAVLFEKVYDGGRLQPGSPHQPFSPATLSPHMAAHPGAEAVNVEGVELLFGALWQRELLQLHQFVAHENDLDAWIDHFLRLRQDFSEDLRLYADAFQEPDPQAMEYYIEALNFYDEADPIIRLARALQREEQPPEIDVEEAVEAAASQSVYAQGLSAAYRNLQMADGLLEGAVGKIALYDHLGISEQNRF